MRRVDQKRLHELIESGYSVAQIQQMTGWSSYAVYNNLKKMGLSTPRTQKRQKKELPSEVVITRIDDTEKNCPECGKIFYVRNMKEWAYRIKKGHRIICYCSWSCYRRRRIKP